MIALSPPPHLLICHREAPEKCHTGLGKRAGTFGHGHAVRGLEPSSHTAPRASNATTTMALTLPFLSFSGIKLVPVRCARAAIAGTRAGPARDLLPRAPRPVPVSSPGGRANSRKKYPPPPHPILSRSAGGRNPRTATAATRYTIRASDGEDEPFEISLKVEGMMCDGCAESVTEALSAAPAVADVKVSLEEKKVSVFVTCDTMMDGLAMMPELVEAVKGAGFEAEPDF